MLHQNLRRTKYQNIKSCNIFRESHGGGGGLRFPLFFFACLGSLLGFWGVKLFQDRGGWGGNEPLSGSNTKHPPPRALEITGTQNVSITLMVGYLKQVVSQNLHWGNVPTSSPYASAFFSASSLAASFASPTSSTYPSVFISASPSSSSSSSVRSYSSTVIWSSGRPGSSAKLCT